MASHGPKSDQASPKSLPADIPPEAVSFLEAMGYLEADRLTVGAQTPQITLHRLDTGEPAVIGDPQATLPTVLIFGSYT